MSEYIIRVITTGRFDDAGEFVHQLFSDDPLADDALHAISEAYEHLPAFEARRHTQIGASKMCWCAFEERSRRWNENHIRTRTQKGKPTRFDKHGRRFDIRAARRSTERQMDTTWLMEMTAPTYSKNETATADYFTAFFASDDWHEADIDDELQAVYARDRELTEQHWQYHHSNPMTEAGQNCHGWGDRDPVEVELEELVAALYPLMLDDSDFWGGYSWPEERTTPTEECPVADWLAWEELTRADWEIEEVIKTAAEEAEDTWFRQFDHVPVGGHQTGRRAQLAVKQAGF